MGSDGGFYKNMDGDISKINGELYDAPLTIL